MCGLTWLILVAALLPASVPAKNIYKFQDENGIWHFTDQAPDEEVEFSTVYMEREPEPRIRLRQEGKKESPVYVLFNDFWGPVEVELTLKESVNVLSEPSIARTFRDPGPDRANAGRHRRTGSKAEFQLPPWHVVGSRASDQQTG